jgi:hypothetical protein
MQLYGCGRLFFRRFQMIYLEIQLEQEIGIEEDEILKAMKIVIYRVTQEGMNYIAKHSKAERVRLSLRILDDHLELVLAGQRPRVRPGEGPFSGEHKARIGPFEHEGTCRTVTGIFCH